MRPRSDTAPSAAAAEPKSSPKPAPRSKSKLAGGEGAGAAAAAAASEGFKAGETTLTDLQRIEVMELVKQGKLTVEEAMKKVLEVEEQQRKQPETDAEGFKTVSNTFDKEFRASSPKDSDDEGEGGKKGALQISIKPVGSTSNPDDPFYIPPAKGDAAPAEEHPQTTADGRRLSSFFQKEDDFSSRAANATAPALENDPFGAPPKSPAMPAVSEAAEAEPAAAAPAPAAAIDGGSASDAAPAPAAAASGVKVEGATSNEADSAA